MRNYHYLMSWSDPLLTLTAMVLFVATCMCMDMEYIGAVPVSLFMVNMTLKYRRRSSGDFIEVS